MSLVYRLMAQSGYPWTLDLHVLYDLSRRRADRDPDRDQPGGRAGAVRLAGRTPTCASGAGPVDDLGADPAGRRPALLADDRLIPVGEEPVDGTAYDFRVARPIARHGVSTTRSATSTRDATGVATATLRDPATGHGVALWVDERHPWLHGLQRRRRAGDAARRSLAVEPMTAPADAFRSGDDLVMLAPAGEPGDEFSVSWGIRAARTRARESAARPVSGRRRARSCAHRDAGRGRRRSPGCQRRGGRAVGEVEGRPRGAGRQVRRRGPAAHS